MPDPAAPDDRPAWLREQTDPRGSATPPSGPVPSPGGPDAPGPVGPGQPGVRSRGPRGDRAPVVTWVILAVNAVLLCVEAFLSGGTGRDFIAPSNVALCRLGALNAAAIAESGQWWRLLTVMVLHAGVIHFALNAYALWMFGPMLERYLGRLRYLAVYLIAGFTGAAASFAINDTVLGVGASGAIFGLLGGLIAFFWRRRDRGGMAQLRGLIIVVVLNLALSASIPNIDNVAHVGGFLGGLVAVWLLDSAPKRGQAVAVRQALALAVPVAAGIALVMAGIATFGGSPYASCAGV